MLFSAAPACPSQRRNMFWCDFTNPPPPQKKNRRSSRNIVVKVLPKIQEKSWQKHSATVLWHALMPIGKKSTKQKNLKHSTKPSKDQVGKVIAVGLMTHKSLCYLLQSLLMLNMLSWAAWLWSRQHRLKVIYLIVLPTGSSLGQTPRALSLKLSPKAMDQNFEHQQQL